MININNDTQENIDFLIANGFFYDKDNDWYVNDVAGIMVTSEMVRFTYPTAFKEHIKKLLNNKLNERPTLGNS